MSKEKPSYFSILTADVRYNSDLTAEEKILFSEITALSQKDGWCYASNPYFAKLYNVSEKSISRRISKLKTAGVLEVRIEKKRGNRRFMRPIIKSSLEPSLEVSDYGQSCLYPMDKSVYTYGQSCPDPMDKSVQHNNTSINNISLLKESDIKTIIDFLNQNSPNDNYDYDDEVAIDLLAIRLGNGHTVDDLKLIIEHKNEMWKDTNTYQYMQPSTLFGEKHFREYLSRARTWAKNGKKPKETFKKKADKTTSKPRLKNNDFAQRDKKSLNSLVSAARKADRRSTDGTEKPAS